MIITHINNTSHYTTIVTENTILTNGILLLITLNQIITLVIIATDTATITIGKLKNNFLSESCFFNRNILALCPTLLGFLLTA